MDTRKLVVALVAAPLMAMSSPVFADPMQLTDAQMDGVTAGSSVNFLGPPIPAPGPTCIDYCPPPHPIPFPGTIPSFIPPPVPIPWIVPAPGLPGGLSPVPVT